MRMSTAYFAGAGTVIAAIALGLGGGLLMANIMSPHSAKHEVTHLERRAASSQAPWQQLSPVAAPDAAQAPVPYLAATEQAVATPLVVAPSPTTQQNTHTTASNDSAAKPAATSPSPPSPAEQATNDPAQNPNDAYARAREADLKRLDAQKKAERRQQWMARRQQHDQDQQDGNNQGWNDNRNGSKGWGDDRRWGDNRRWHDDSRGWHDDRSDEVIVRREDPDDTGSPGFGRPMRFDFPRYNLFGPRD